MDPPDYVPPPINREETISYWCGTVATSSARVDVRTVRRPLTHACAPHPRSPLPQDAPAHPAAPPRGRLCLRRPHRPRGRHQLLRELVRPLRRQPRRRRAARGRPRPRDRRGGGARRPGRRARGRGGPGGRCPCRRCGRCWRRGGVPLRLVPPGNVVFVDVIFRGGIAVGGVFPRFFGGIAAGAGKIEVEAPTP